MAHPIVFGTVKVPAMEDSHIDLSAEDLIGETVIAVQFSINAVYCDFFIVHENS